MEKNEFNKFIEALKKTSSMREEERLRMREYLESYADHMPARERVEGRLPNQGRPSWFSGLLVNKRHMTALASLLIVIMAGGGAAVAAEGSLPGDLLYPVKVEVTENVRGALTFGAESDAEWDVEKAQRRMQEAVELSSSARLDEETRVEIEERIRKHSEEALRRAEELEGKGQAEAALAIRNDLDAHINAYSSVFGVLAAAVDDVTATNIIDLQNSLGVFASTEASSRAVSVSLFSGSESDSADESMTMESSLTAREAADTQMEMSVEKEITFDAYYEMVAQAIEEAEKAVEEAEGSFKTEAETHLEIAVAAFERAQAALAADDFTSAQLHLSEAHRAAISAQVFSENSSILDLPLFTTPGEMHSHIRLETRTDVDRWDTGEMPEDRIEIERVRRIDPEEGDEVRSEEGMILKTETGYPGVDVDAEVDVGF